MRFPPSVKELLKLSRSSYEMFRSFQKQLVETLRTNRVIRDRVNRLMTIPGVGEITRTDVGIGNRRTATVYIRSSGS